VAQKTPLFSIAFEDLKTKNKNSAKMFLFLLPSIIFSFSALQQILKSAASRNFLYNLIN